MRSMLPKNDAMYIDNINVAIKNHFFALIDLSASGNKETNIAIKMSELSECVYIDLLTMK